MSKLKGKKNKNLFRYLWEWYAYLAAFLDDTVLLAIKKMQEKADIEEDPKKKKKIHEKILKIIGKWLSSTLWEAWAWFYEKYADLKKWENLAETALEEDIPRMMLKWKLTLTKMDTLWLEKWNIEHLKKLKDWVDLNDRIKIKWKQLTKKMEVLKIKKWSVKWLKKLVKK